MNLNNKKTFKNKDSRNKIMNHDNEKTKNKKLKKKIDVNKLYELIDKKKIVNNNMFVEKDYIDMMRQSNYALTKELKNLQEENKNLKNQILNDNKNIFTVNFNNNINDSKITLLNKEIELLNSENKILKNKIDDYLNKISDLENKQKNDAFLLIENEHLKNDISRISKLLTSTTEYQDLGMQADSTGAIRYLKEIGYYSKLDLWENTKKRGKYHCNACLVDEKYLWIPRSAYNFSHKILNDFNGKLDETIIEYLLFEINKIFTLRENNVIKCYKSKFLFKIQKLKNQLKKDPNRNLKDAIKEINILKKELKLVKKENIENNYKNNFPKEFDLIEKNLKYAAKYSSFKRQTDKEIMKYKNCCSNMKKKIKDDKVNNHFINVGSKNTLSLIKKIFEAINLRVNNCIEDYKKSNEKIINGNIDNNNILAEKEDFILDMKDAINDMKKEIMNLVYKNNQKIK